MPMVSFGSEFPDVALKEAHRVVVNGNNTIPDGKYLFLDSYCDEHDCDCRRVMINVVSNDSPEYFLATINYGWEDVEFYKGFMYGDEEDAKEAAEAVLDPLNYQSALAPVFLELFKESLSQSYIEILKKHYEMFKQAIKAKQTIRNEAKNRYGRKIGRNDSCPCGSGKKYKKCCGE